jgi:hypothetical protein
LLWTSHLFLLWTSRLGIPEWIYFCFLRIECLFCFVGNVGSLKSQVGSYLRELIQIFHEYLSLVRLTMTLDNAC